MKEEVGARGRKVKIEFNKIERSCGCHRPPLAAFLLYIEGFYFITKIIVLYQLMGEYVTVSHTFPSLLLFEIINFIGKVNRKK